MTEKHGDVRAQMHSALMGQKPILGPPDNPPPRVLLIDEVDVFLDPTFFGGAYRPALMIQD